MFRHFTQGFAVCVTVAVALSTRCTEYPNPYAHAPELSLPADTVDIVVGEVLSGNVPEVTNWVTVDSYTVAPPLPAGVLLDPSTGALSGTPGTPLPWTSYEITAHNRYGTGTASFHLSVANPG